MLLTSSPIPPKYLHAYFPQTRTFSYISVISDQNQGVTDTLHLILSSHPTFASCSSNVLYPKGHFVFSFFLTLMTLALLKLQATDSLECPSTRCFLLSRFRFCVLSTVTGDAVFLSQHLLRWCLVAICLLLRTLMSISLLGWCLPAFSM